MRYSTSLHACMPFQENFRYTFFDCRPTIIFRKLSIATTNAFGHLQNSQTVTQVVPKASIAMDA
jgi:hypothetical protein